MEAENDEQERVGEIGDWDISLCILKCVLGYNAQFDYPLLFVHVTAN